MLAEIQPLVEAADFDEALKKLSRWKKEQLAAVIHHQAPDLNQIRFACMASDLYDYAGRFLDAAFCIGLVAAEANRQVRGFLENTKVENYRSPIEYSRLVKQCCWALIHVATVDYRKGLYPEALSLLDGIVKSALEALDRQKMKLSESTDPAERTAYSKFAIEGTQSRLWYGIGLIRRQGRKERLAREAFTRSILYASQGVESHLARGDGDKVAFYDYSVGKAMGLGLGWISYSEARLSESLAELVAARRLLVAAKGVRFIRAYIDVIYSRVLLSAYGDVPERVDEAINTLERVLPELASHDLYRHRGDYAMSLSRVARYMIRNRSNHASDPPVGDLYAVLQTIDDAKSSSWLHRHDRATLCNFLVLQSRIRRIQEDSDGALQAASEAWQLGESIDFVKADCLICLGEAHYFKGNYSTAIEHFRSARSAAEGSRKLRAASELHLARAYSRSQNRAQAREHFQEWKISGAAVENVFIRNLSAELSAELNDFMVAADVESLMAETHLNELRHWLAVEATRRWGKLKREDREREFREQTGKDAKTIKRWLNRNFGESEGNGDARGT